MKTPKLPALCRADRMWMERLMTDLLRLARGEAKKETRERLADLGLPSLRDLLPKDEQEQVYLILSQEGDRLTTVRPGAGVIERAIADDELIIYSERPTSDPRYWMARKDRDKYGEFHTELDLLQPADVILRGEEDHSLGELLAVKWAEEFLAEEDSSAKFTLEPEPEEW